MAAGKPGSQHSEEQVVLTEVKGHVRFITLNNPRKLNVANREVAIKLADLYEKWEKENDVEMIIVKGVGRAFSVGGDYTLAKNGKEDTRLIETIYKIYWRQYHIHTYQKTLVSFVNGIAMGSGASLAVECTFRIITENAIFAAPEVAFGFHTDAGLSYILSHLPGHLGEYLALTGSRFNGAEMVAIGLGTHYIPSKKLEELEKRLVYLNTGDKNIVRETIEDFSIPVQPGEKSILHNGYFINRCFSKDTVEDIIKSLEESDMDGNKLVKDTIKKLKRCSPTSLKMTLRSVRQARKQTLFECLKNEFRLSINTVRGVISNDCYEGARAFFIDKDKSPKWNPPSLREVSEDKLDLIFKPLEEEFELQLPREGKIPRWEGKYECSGYHIKNPNDYEDHSTMTKFKSRM